MRGELNDRRIPKTMASQHPDNAKLPEWVRGEVIAAGDDEVYEAYVAYSVYGCEEVMWDSEGKDVDPHVVRKLISGYPEFFGKRLLGRDIFLTLRGPNPSVEVTERKLLLETLEMIPRHNDVAAAFYNDEGYVAVFEFILPFTSSHVEMIRVKEAYRSITTEALSRPIDRSGFLLKEWVGEAVPADVEVIPLFEDLSSINNIEYTVSKYVEIVKPRYLRVFIARSDPSMHYGNIVATLLAKWALDKCKRLEDRLDIPIHPIIGTGSLPFRGHNSPLNVDNFIDEYRGVETVTIQPSFRYDYPRETVVSAIRRLNESLPYGTPERFDDSTLLSVLEKLIKGYQSTVTDAIDAVNSLVAYVPSRRSRKLHIGPFGYARQLLGKKLPRAIPFCAAFYTLGIPPEFIGVDQLFQLSDREMDVVVNGYKHLRDDLIEAGRRVSWENIELMRQRVEEVRKLFGQRFLDNFLEKYVKGLRLLEENFSISTGPKSFSDRRYLNLVENVLLGIFEGDTVSIRDDVVRAAVMRGSIG
ncbi:MAG: phosphoenolpyruvate carboxylase [Aigarchaeota archaeon]|nr:phosphoenolpyruvate carboxylase [Aigarchaeota archaeon]MDW8092752.1 phosphoenolpyruvate carboxylase [Nitrososphaerota archaeon]